MILDRLSFIISENEQAHMAHCDPAEQYAKSSELAVCLVWNAACVNLRAMHQRPDWSWLAVKHLNEHKSD